MLGVWICYKLQALEYDILSPTTTIVEYAIGFEKLSANEQFFDDDQTAVSLEPVSYTHLTLPTSCCV